MTPPPRDKEFDAFDDFDAPSLEIEPLDASTNAEEDDGMELPLPGAGAHEALSLIDVARDNRRRAPSPREQVEAKLERDDFSGALEILEEFMNDPALAGDRPAFDEYHARCVSRLQQMYLSRLGSLDQVPVLAVKPHELHWFNMGHRAGFVLSLVDGTSSLRDVIDVSSMPEFEVIRTLAQLTEQRVILLRLPR